MNLKQQRKMVKEYNLHRTQTIRLTAEERFQLGVRLLVPTAITRLVAAIEHHDMPAAHVPRYGQAWEQLLPPTSACAKQWSGDVTLPIPSRLPAAMHWQDAQLLCRIILGASSPSLAPLEQLYFRANLRYCFLAADDVYPLLGFVAAIDDLPRSDSGPVTLLLLHLSLLHGSKPALVQQRKAGMSSQAQQDSDALRQQLLAVLQSLWCLPESLQPLSAKILSLDLPKRLAELLAALTPVQRAAVLRERKTPETLEHMGVPQRGYEYMPTERLALLELQRRLLPTIGTQIGVAEWIVGQLDLLGDRRGAGDLVRQREKVDALRSRLRVWGQE